jgi:Na+-transporting NADH:ubiquinone oxidoreductase subunit NqrC
MKNSPLTTILLGVLTLSALASVLLCWLYISNTRQLRTLQTQAAFINNNRNIINALVSDTLEYSKTHAAIEPVLQSFNLKLGKTSPAASSKPATK